MGFNVIGSLSVIWRFIMRFPLFMPYKKRSACNKNLVRMIGSNIPLPPTQKMYTNLFNNHCMKNSDIIYNDLELSECLCHHEVKSLQDEVDGLKKLINSLILDKERKNLSGSTGEKQEFKSAQPPPPPLLPPPPPPPLPPPFSPMTPKPLIKATKKHYTPRYDPQSPAAALSLVLSQMSSERPKLRHVERSPGGRPIKKKKNEDIDPSNILSHILKLRYSALHTSSESIDTLGEVKSPDSKFFVS